ncbi:hypothetical protein EGI32_02190 [Ferruginibacter sp. HRS2-29]|nr:hypothetical protein [Ferruginibacter sp. HRS2-29]
MYGSPGEVTNRTPEFTSMQKGVLKKVIYPTGGSEEFNYEQHTLPEQVYDSSFTVVSTEGTGPNSNITQYTMKTITFTTGAIPFAKTTIKSEINPGYTSNIPEDNHMLFEFQLYQGTTAIGPILKKKEYGEFKQNYSSFYLQPFTEYRAEIKIFLINTKATLTIEHSPVLTARWQNNPACGLRVNNIVSFDPVSNKQTTRYYKYAGLTNLQKSTGMGMLVPDLSQHYEGGGTCASYTTGSSVIYSQILCNNLAQFSSSSISGTISFGGSSVAYTDVIESDDAAFVNGGIQHSFYTELNDSRPLPKLGSIMPSAPRNLYADRNGIEEKTIWFKKNGTGFTTLKKSESTYSVDNRVSYSFTSYVNRQKWEPIGTLPNNEKLLAFDCGEYKYNSIWFHLDNISITEYDQDGQNPMVTSTSYEYNNIQHTQPTKITTTNSKNEILVQESTYPADYATLPYTAMVADYIISPVIESKSSKAGNVMAIVKTDYKNWSGKIYRPEIVNMQKGSNPANKEPRLHYYAMTSNGNALEVAKEDGIRMSYVWDYENTMAIAEVKNAQVTDIAYSSFETPAGTGNWTLTGTLLPAGSSDLNNYWTTYTDALTGKRSFGGKITKTVSPGKNYTITLWAKSGSNTPTVNNLAGTLLLTKGSWNLYKWNVTGVSSVAVQCNQMDEVRLHPAGAFMTSYTYIPFVGTLTITDPVNNIQYYEYDGLNRLLRVRDIDRNILKQYDYQYNQAITPCANKIANWLPTGNTRCLTNSNNVYTGAKEKEERDENNCSPTYLSLRWTATTTGVGECVNTVTCTGADKRLVNGVCETGVKTLVSSVKSGNTWYCTWKYVWSDGYESATFLTTGSTKCLGGLVEL